LRQTLQSQAGAVAIVEGRAGQARPADMKRRGTQRGGKYSRGGSEQQGRGSGEHERGSEERGELAEFLGKRSEGEQRIAGAPR